MSPAAAIRPSLFAGLCALAFGTMLSYAIAGTSTQALFLSAHGTQKLPLVWLFVAVGSAVAVGAVNIAARYISIVGLFVWASLMSTLVLLGLLVAQAQDVAYVSFALYVWKDVYIIVLVELFWSFANVAFGVRTASRTYGLFCAAGSLGAIVGSAFVGALAGQIGTAALLWTLPPILLGGAGGCAALASALHGAGPKAPPSVRQTLRHSLTDGVAVLRNSRTLLLLMGLVATVQLVLTLNDFQFNAAVQTSFASLDARTTALAQINGLINVVSFALQMGTGFLLHKVGMPRLMLAMPALLGLSLGATLYRPQYASLALCQIVGKCSDYSVFRACKEIVYIPLSYAEKTRGKALIDIFVYRVAKGGVGLLLLALAGLGTHVGVKIGTLCLCAAWFGLAWSLVRRHRRLAAAAACMAR